MKTIFILFAILLLCGCHEKKRVVLSPDIENNETINYPYRYCPEDSVYVNLKVYNPEEAFHIILDSIIESSKECDSYKKDSVGFLFQVENSIDEIIFTISNVRIKNYNPAFCDALFYHKNYKFYYCGALISQLFQEAGKTERVHGVHPEKDLLLFSDDMGAAWTYKNKDNKISVVNFYKCDHTWWSNEH